MTAVIFQMGRREHKKTQVRDRLYEVGLQLFRRHGYEHVSVRAITSEAGTAKGTFFNHYPTKEHLLARYHDELMGRILERFERIRSRSSRGAVLRAMQICCAEVELELDLGRVLLSVMFTSAVLREHDRANSARQVRWFHQQIEHGICRGEFRRDFDPAVFVSLLAAILSSSTIAWVQADGHPDLGAELRERTELLLSAIEAGKA